jgi:hypothetical protein
MAISALAIPAAISAGSSLVSALATDTPEVPDFSGMVDEEFDDARRAQAEQAEEQRQNLEETLAATGASAVGSAANREEMFDAQSSARAELEGRAAQAIQDAIRRERMMEFEQERRRQRNRARAISSIGQAASSAAIAAGAGEDGFGFGGDGGGGGGTGVVDFSGTDASRVLEGFTSGPTPRPAGANTRGEIIDMIQFTQ